MNKSELMNEGEMRYGSKNSSESSKCPHCGKELRNIHGTFGDEVAHHIKDLGMKPKQAVAVAYKEAGEK